MTQTHFSLTADIPAPAPLVWAVLADVEGWPQWTASVARVKSLSPGPLRVGNRVRIKQPSLPPAVWRVTGLNPGVDFTWVSRAPGVTVTARHAVGVIAGGARVTLSIHYAGWLGGWLACWVGDLNPRYLALEANGLKARCTGLASKNPLELHEAH